MDELDIHQSELLKKISLNEVTYSALNDEDKKVCRFLVDVKYCIYQHEWVKTNIESIPLSLEISGIVITELGKQYLYNESILLNERDVELKRLAAVEQIADSAKHQAESALAEAKRSKRSAIIASIIAIVGIIIGFLPMWGWITQLITWLQSLWK